MDVVHPFDPRFLKYACGARWPILLATLSDTLTAPVVIAQVLLISHSVSPAIEGHAALADVLRLIVPLALLTLLRGLLVTAREITAQYGADHTIRDLRAEVFNATQALDPRWRAIHASGTTALFARGLDDPGLYFVKLFPQLTLTSTATPLAPLVMALLDLWSAFTVFLVIPLIPVLMIFIGRFT